MTILHKYIPWLGVLRCDFWAKIFPAEFRLKTETSFHYHPNWISKERIEKLKMSLTPRWAQKNEDTMTFTYERSRAEWPNEREREWGIWTFWSGKEWKKNSWRLITAFEQVRLPLHSILEEDRSYVAENKRVWPSSFCLAFSRCSRMWREWGECYFVETKKRSKSRVLPSQILWINWKFSILKATGVSSLVEFSECIVNVRFVFRWLFAVIKFAICSHSSFHDSHVQLCTRGGKVG